MRVLVVDGFDHVDHLDHLGHVDHAAAGDPASALARRVVRRLELLGNEVDMLSLASGEFDRFMDEAERLAYETDAPLLDPVVKASADLVTSADALLFVYPTTLFGVPPIVKSWIERVMVLGVAFAFDDKRRVRPALTNIRRLGVVTSSQHSAWTTWRARYRRYRLFMRTLRLNCHLCCRRTFARIPASAPGGRIDDQLARSLRSWRTG